MRERYGFDAPFHDPAGWILDLVSLLAVTETFLGYGESEDFPFSERLPLSSLRPNHKQLLQRWLRDAEYRIAWDRCIEKVEAKVDLGVWASGHTGLSFGFPHLSRLRLQQTYEAFESAAVKESSTADFFASHAESIAKEVEFAKASAQGGAVWLLLRDLSVFIDDCAGGIEKTQGAKGMADIVRVYIDAASRIEWRHIELRRGAEEEGRPSVARVADRAYASYALALNDAFFHQVASIGSLEGSGLRSVTARLDAELWNAHGRRAVIIVDALRYDCALALRDRLSGNVVEVEPMMAVLPTVTPVGMTALLPLGGDTVTIEIKANAIHPWLKGKDCSVRDNRLAVLRDFGADCRDIGDLEQSSEPPSRLGELLVVYGHEEVDQLGHGQAESLIRHIHLEIDRLGRLVRKLHRWGYPQVHVVTDHGFILLDESKLPAEIPCDKAWCLLLKERYALVPSGADVPLVRLPFPWDKTMCVAIPPGLAFFKAEKAFSHGGAALQELIIPHLVSRGQASREKRIGVEVVVPAHELQRAVVKLILRPASASRIKPDSMALFMESGRTLSVDVFRRGTDGTIHSVLAGNPKNSVWNRRAQTARDPLSPFAGSFPGWRAPRARYTRCRDPRAISAGGHQADGWQRHVRRS